jgi:hypothetical protein
MHDATQPLPDGWYWYEEVNGDLEVIEVDGGTVYRTGSDVSTRLAAWPDKGEFHVLEGRVICRVEPPARVA